MGRLELWNAAESEAAEAALLSCCGSPDWVRRLAERRPYAEVDHLLVCGEAVWLALPEEEWLKAFACHPRIGERKAAAATTEHFAAWSASEQETAQASLDDVAEALVEANREYEARFGFLYIVCAEGRTAPELLAVLQARLAGSRDQELAEAARQQWAITRRRMSRWLLD